MTYCCENNSGDISKFHYTPNDIRQAILHNKKLEKKLHMIICISNPCQYVRRFDLARRFIQTIENNHKKDVLLYVVELAYGNDKFFVTNKRNKRHLQIRTETSPLWHKENLLNIGVEKLLPKDWKCVAFVDSDIEFDNPHFATDTLKLLNKTYDILQMNSHTLDLDLHKNPMSIFTSHSYQLIHRRPYGKTGISYWHPGFNLAMTRKTYEKLGGLYQYSILGSGDHNMMMSLIQKAELSVHSKASQGYKQSVLDYQTNCAGLRLGYTPGVIRHYFHGSKKNRKYVERWGTLVENQYDPKIHVKLDENGLIIPTEQCPQKLLKDIMSYFCERNEDESVDEMVRIASTII